MSNDLAALILDAFPVSEGHCLIVPKRHVASLFDLTEDELLAMWGLISQAREMLDKRYSPSGYNLGVNVGKDAGQTVFHCHIHIIPRHPGDDPDPRGGVRKIKRPLREY